MTIWQRQNYSFLRADDMRERVPLMWDAESELVRNRYRDIARAALEAAAPEASDAE